MELNLIDWVTETVQGYTAREGQGEIQQLSPAFGDLALHLDPRFPRLGSLQKTAASYSLLWTISCPSAARSQRLCMVVYLIHSPHEHSLRPEDLGETPVSSGIWHCTYFCNISKRPGHKRVP